MPTQPRRTGMHVAPSAAGSNIAAYQATPAWRQRLAEQALQRNQKIAEGGGTSTAPAVGPNPSVPQYYQVQKDDTMESISWQNGVPLQQITDINKTKTPPPKGSYIQLSYGGQGTPYSVPGSNQGPGYNYYNPYADPAARLRTYKQGQTLGALSPIDPYRSSTGAYYSAQAITQTLASGQLPSAIPISLLSTLRDSNGNRTTIDDWLAEGYTIKNGALVAPGTPGAGGTIPGSNGRLPGPSAEYMQTKGYQLGYDASTGQLNMNALRWDPSTKKYVSIAKLVKQGKLNMKTGRNQRGKRRGKNEWERNDEAPAPPPVAVEPTRQGPDTILDIHLGSG